MARIPGFSLRDDSGSIGLTFALVSTLVMMAVGAAVDYSRGSSLKARLQAATDSTTLTMVRQASKLNDQDLRIAVQKQLTAMLPGVTVSVDKMTVGSARTDLELLTSAPSKNTFMGIVGLQTLMVRADSRSVVSNTSFEIALVMDNSGSMASSAGGASKMQSAKDAANKLIDTMITSTSTTSTKFSIVPFTLAVQVGKQYNTASWMDLTGKSSIHWQNFDFTKTPWAVKSRFDIFTALGVPWGGCVESRPGNWGTTDAAPTASDPDSYFVPMFAPDEPGNSGDFTYTWSTTTWWYLNSYLDDNPSIECKNDVTGNGQYTRAQSKVCKYQNKSSLDTSYGRGPNYSCDAQPLQRLTNNTSALHAAVNAMQAAGNTDLLEGFMWGWRTLSPNAPFADGKSSNTTGNQKIIILLTDGMNNWGSAPNHNLSVYSPFGFYTNNRLGTGATDAASARALLDAKTLQGCTNAKAQGITVYTVGFSVSTDPIDAGGLDLLKKCASAPSYAFVASDSSAIVAVFDEIARNIGALRLTN